MNKTIDMSIHNKFEIEVIDANTGEVKQKAQAFNTVCDQLWARIFAPNTYFNYIHFGGGTGTPAATDTSLFSYIGCASVSNGNNSISWKDGVYWSTKSIQLIASAYVGRTITEVGIGYDGNSSSLCTHAMLQDMDGNPTSITKTDTDVVNIYATIYVHFNPNGYKNGNIQIYNCPSYNIFRWLSGSYYSYDIPAKAQISGDRGTYTTSSNYKSLSLSRKFDLDTKTIKFTAARMEASSVYEYTNGICSVVLGNDDYEYIYIKIGGEGNWYPYSQITGEQVAIGDGATKDFQIKYPFAHDAKVYIDGVETTDFTLDYGTSTTVNSTAVDWIYFMDGLRYGAATPDKHVYRPYETWSGNYTNAVFYNPMHELGISSVSGYLYNLYTSNDLENWVEIASYSSSSNKTITIPEEYIHNKYWKYDGTASYIGKGSGYAQKALHFTTPPASGSVITIDYRTDSINKDENCVFDFTFTMRLGEYVE